MSNSKRYFVTLIGCDDSTGFAVYLTESEAQLLHSVAEISRETSENDCMPVMEIESEERRNERTRKEREEYERRNAEVIRVRAERAVRLAERASEREKERQSRQQENPE